MSLLVGITNKEVIGFQIFSGSVKSMDFGSFILQIVREN